VVRDGATTEAAWPPASGFDPHNKEGEPSATWRDHCSEFVCPGWRRWDGVPETATLEPDHGRRVADGRTDDGVHRELRFWDEATRTLTVLTYDDLR
jgi:hypothetical protein